MNNIETLNDVAIADEYEKLAGIKDAGSEQAKVTIDGVTKLLDRKIEMEKLEIERAEREQARKDERTDRIVKNVLTGVSVVGGLALTVWGSLMSWKFEEKGEMVTSFPGKKFINKLFDKK
jgi:hypothetical protein